MELSHLDQLIQLENSYWWHVAKRAWATNLLSRYIPPPSRIIEGGIGAAGNLIHWKKMGYEVAGLDCMSESIAHATNQGLTEVYEHDLHQPWPVRPNSASAVILLDVLEHLQNPVLALRHAASCLENSGKIIFTVPAYPILFSDWDVRLGHFRRYTARAIREQATEAGLSVVQLSHWNSFTLPAAFVLRLIRRVIPSSAGTEFPKVSAAMNRMLIRFAQWEQRLSSALPVPVGLSLVGVLSK